MTMPSFMPVRAGSAAVLALLLASCGATEYEPATTAGDTGYEVTQIAEDRYRVSFVGNSATERQTVETYLLYRAAEVAAQTGHPYFALVREETDRDVDVDTFYTASPGLYGFGTGFGVGVGYGFPYYSTFGYGARPVTTVQDSYQAYATVEMLESRAAGREDVYDTQAVLIGLRPRIDFPSS